MLATLLEQRASTIVEELELRDTEPSSRDICHVSSQQSLGQLQVAVLVTACFLLQASAHGIYCSYGSLFKALQLEFGMSESTAALVGSACDAAYNICCLPAGLLLKGIGCPRMASAGSLLFAIGLLLDSIAPNVPCLMASHTLVGIAMAFVFMPAATGVLCLDSSIMAICVGIASMGSGIGTIIWIQFLEHFIDAWGWRGTLKMCAGIAGITSCIGCALFALVLPWRPEQQQEQQQAGNSLLKFCKDTFRPLSEGRVMAWNLSIFIYMFGYKVPFTFLAPFAKLHVNTAGPVFISTLMLASALGRFLFGYLCARVSPTQVFIGLLLAQGIALASLGACRTDWALHLFSVVYGATGGGRSTCLSLVTGHLFGMDRATHLYGMAALFTGFGVLGGPPVVGLTYQALGRYWEAFLLCGSMMLVSVPIVCLLASKNMPTARAGTSSLLELTPLSQG